MALSPRGKEHRKAIITAKDGAGRVKGRKINGNDREIPFSPILPNAGSEKEKQESEWQEPPHFRHSGHMPLKTVDGRTEKPVSSSIALRMRSEISSSRWQVRPQTVHSICIWCGHLSGSE